MTPRDVIERMNDLYQNGCPSMTFFIETANVQYKVGTRRMTVSTANNEYKAEVMIDDSKTRWLRFDIKYESPVNFLTVLFPPTIREQTSMSVRWDAIESIKFRFWCNGVFIWRTIYDSRM